MTDEPFKCFYNGAWLPLLMTDEPLELIWWPDDDPPATIDYDEAVGMYGIYTSEPPCFTHSDVTAGQIAGTVVVQPKEETLQERNDRIWEAVQKISMGQ